MLTKIFVQFISRLKLRVFLHYLINRLNTNLPKTLCKSRSNHSKPNNRYCQIFYFFQIIFHHNLISFQNLLLNYNSCTITNNHNHPIISAQYFIIHLHSNNGNGIFSHILCRQQLNDYFDLKLFPNTFAIFSTFSIKCLNTSSFNDCGPSDNALSGSG